MRLSALSIAIFLSMSGAVFAQSTQTPNTDKKAPISTPVEAEVVKKAEQDPDKPATLKAPVEQPTPDEIENALASPWWDKLLQPGVAALAGLGGALIGALVGRWNTVAAINQKANELEIKEIQSRMNEFYGRFQQVAEENHLIAREFKSHQGEPSMRTLLKLLDPEWRASLSPSDKEIVKSLVENGNMLRSLIREKSGLVDPAILPYLSRAALHFAMLDLAHAEKLENEPDRFEKFVYPRVLDEVLVLETGRLNGRIRKLVQESSKSHAPMEALHIPPELFLPKWV